MACRRTMHEVTEEGTLLEKLKTLSMVIADQIDAGDGSHSMAQLARQYRETVAEIARIEEEDDDLDEIAQIVARSG